MGEIVVWNALSFGKGVCSSDENPVVIIVVFAALQIINALDFGSPSERQRVFLIATHASRSPPRWPRPFTPSPQCRSRDQHLATSHNIRGYFGMKLAGLLSFARPLKPTFNDMCCACRPKVCCGLKAGKACCYCVGYKQLLMMMVAPFWFPF